MSQRKIKAQRRQEKLASKIFERNIEKTEIKGIRQILKENWKFLLILLMGVIVIYYNSLWGDFVSDDYASITQNPDIGNLWKMIGTTPNFLNWLTYVLFGNESTIPYHTLSLIIYLLSIVVCFVFVKKIINEKHVTELTILLFAVLPIHVEAVSWISGRIYMVLTIYIISGLLFFMKMIETKNWWFGVGTLIMFLLAFLTDKPRPLSLIFLIFWYLYYINNRLVKIDFSKFFLICFGVLVVAGILAYPAIKNRINNVNFGYRGDGGIFYDPFFQYPTGITKYLQLILIPIDLTLYHTMYTFPVWLNWLVVLTFFSLLVWSFAKDKRYFFALSFFLLTLAPSMAPVKVSWLVAERYVFLPSLGICLLLVLFFADISKMLGSSFKFVLGFLGGLLVLIYAVRVVYRNIDWQTNHLLWVATVQVSPNSHNAWNNIGDDYDKLGQYENAIKGFTQSTVMKPNYADAFHNRANIYFKTGFFDLARDSYMTALSFNPGLIQTYISLVQIELTVGRLDAALEIANKVVDIDPNNFQVRYVKAVVLKELDMLAEAKKEAVMSLQLNPNYQPAKQLINDL